MSNVVFSAGWRSLRREAVVGWVALTAGAVLFAVVAAVVSRLGVGRDPAMAIALMVAGPAAVWSLLWILDSGVTSRRTTRSWVLQVRFANYTGLTLLIIAGISVWLKADPVYQYAPMMIASAYIFVTLVLLNRRLSRLTIEIRLSLALYAIRNLEQRELNIVWMVSKQGEQGAAAAANLSPEETHAVYRRAVEKIESSLDEIPAA